MKKIEYLRNKANSLLEQPGVYIMKDSEGTIIYVGKSKKLKNRVTSYFSSHTHTPKTAKMVSQVDDFDYIVCKTEIEALSLENVLIKKHSPKYNIKLKDAKSYPYVKVTNEEYPRLFITRERLSDKSSYYGPYMSASIAKNALDTVSRIFSLASCKRSFPRDIGKMRPCIYKEMGRCVAPCDGKIGSEGYRALVKNAERMLSGKVNDTLEMLKDEMQEASENMEFERAAVLRDGIKALTALREKQNVVAGTQLSRDVFAIYASELDGALAVLTIRDGALINKNEFILSSKDELHSEDLISLIANYYDSVSSDIPREIMLDFPLSNEDSELLSEYLSLNRKNRVSVKFPERGEGRALCEMARKNAEEGARQYRLEGERRDKNLLRLAELLDIPLPIRIEAYDISNICDENINASMIVYENGKLKKSDYRSFSIKSTKTRDDYASVREALTRRLLHIGDGSASLSQAPDLILIDGGAGHVAVGKAVLSELSLNISLFGMVKDEFHKTRAITDGEREISIAREMGVYMLVYKIQEEAHRFALSKTMGQKKKSLTSSSLEKIKGIGPKKAKEILSLKTLAELKRMSIYELSLLPKISQRDAQSIYSYFHKN
jgi:excinuclease ABC subunit C